jgi:hypothetical protein
VESPVAQSQASDTSDHAKAALPLLNYRERSISRYERKIMNRLKRQHDEQLPWNGFFVQLIPVTTILGIYLILLAIWFGWQSPIFTCVAGLYCGILINGFGIYRRARRSWPIMSSLIDWQRVDRFVKDDEERKSSIEIRR